MDEKSLSHTRCKYQPLNTGVSDKSDILRWKNDIGEILRRLCYFKCAEIIEAHAIPDHIHMLISIQPKLAVSNFVWYLKGKY